MERLPQPLLVFGYNTEGNQHCWSMGWGEPRGEENHGSSRREHSAPAAAVWPEDGDGLGRPKFHAASCWATSKESFVLWTSLPQSFPHLFSEVLQNLLMWLKKKGTAPGSADTDQGPVLSGLCCSVLLPTYISCWPRASFWSAWQPSAI